MFIYIITNTINGKQYIGQTIRPITQRFTEHCKNSSGKHSIITRAMCKYGREFFLLEQIRTCTNQKELDEYETYYIKMFGTLAPFGYNLTTGGEHPMCSNIPEAVEKRKIARSRQFPPTKGMKQSLEWIKKRVASTKQTRILKHKNKPVVIKDGLQNLHLVRPIIKDETEFYISMNKMCTALCFDAKSVLSVCRGLISQTKGSVFRYATIEEIQFNLADDLYRLNKILNNPHFRDLKVQNADKPTTLAA